MSCHPLEHGKTYQWKHLVNEVSLFPRSYLSSLRAGLWSTYLCRLKFWLPWSNSDNHSYCVCISASHAIARGQHSIAFLPFLWLLFCFSCFLFCDIFWILANRRRLLVVVICPIRAEHSFSYSQYFDQLYDFALAHAHSKNKIPWPRARVAHTYGHKHIYLEDV